MQAYYYLTKMRILTTMAYRFEVFASIGSNLVLMVATVFLWNTAYSGIMQVEQLDLNKMVTYAIVSVILGSLFQCGVQNTIYNKVREGSIVTDFIRPVRLLACYLADDIGSVVSALFTRTLPLIIFATLFISVSAPSNAMSALLFIPSCLLSYGILWLLSALVGMVAFWVMELGNMGIVKDAIVRVLSGGLVPLWFFPESIQTISKYLPFQYTYQTPLGIYVGVIPPIEALKALAVQGIWIAILSIFVLVVWQKAKRMTLIQGG